MTSEAAVLNDAGVRQVALHMGVSARKAARVLANMPSEQRHSGLIAMAEALRENAALIVATANTEANELRQRGATPAFIDRMMVTPAAVEAMANGIEAVAALPDPVGSIEAEWTRPNGLHISRVRVPIGVVGMIYESRPNVTADAAALCLKSGNAVILRPGSEAAATSGAIEKALQTGLSKAGIPRNVLQITPTKDRRYVELLLSGLDGALDLIIPRGGKSLVALVQKEARVPVLAHLEGNCHVYVDKSADTEKAKRIVLNAKMRRVSVCGAAETLLVDRAGADKHLKPLVQALLDAGCELRGDTQTQAVDARVKPASEDDWYTEYLDAIMAVRVVDGVDGAIAHIASYGSSHTDAIVTEDKAALEKFLKQVDSAIVLANASTQFADGAEFGFGAEIGIATGRLHARGPVGARELTTTKYIVRGDGQIRP